MGVPLLTGSVLHRAREQWATNHSLDMVALTQEAWLELATKSSSELLKAVKAYRSISKRSVALKAEICEARPDIKAPDRTKEFKASSVYRELGAFNVNFTNLLAKDGYNWVDKPLPEAFDMTIMVAEKYQEKYRDSPESLLTEMRFSLTSPKGHTLMGIIDDLSLLISTDGEPLAYAIVDAKSYQREPNALKDFLQLAMYHYAGTQLLPTWLDQVGLPVDNDLPLYVGLDLMVLLERRFYQLTDAQVSLAMDLTATYDTWRDHGTYLPNLKSMSCSYCEWLDTCTERVGLVSLEADIL